jgi:thiamine transport system substrate-binding protein
MFLKGEAPWVWSYTTSQAYHRLNGDSQGRYRAQVFEEAMPVQIEGAAWVKLSKNPELAQKFLEFLVSEKAQTRIPTGNWMLPVRKNVPLPTAFSNLPHPKKLLSLAPSSGLGRGTPVDPSAAVGQDVLKLWSEAIRR